MGQADRPIATRRGLPSRPGRRGGEIRRRRVRADRTWPGPRSAGGCGGQRVRLSRGLDRASVRGPHHRSGAAGHRRTAPAAGRDCVRRHPNARGYARLRPDGRDRAGLDGPPCRRTPLPRLSPPPHNRRCLRVLGVARARHRGRARRAGLLPRAEGLRGARGAALPGRGADRGEPHRPRRDRRRGAGRRAARARRRRTRCAGRPAAGSRHSPDVRRARSGRNRPGPRSNARGRPVGPACATC